VIFLGANDIVLFAIISFVSGLSLGADIAFPTSIQADIVQKVKEVQDNISGILFGIWTMITKLALALSVVITFGILGIVDFDKDNLTQTSIITLTLLYGLLPIILKLIALKFIVKFNESTS
jgi:Na+/melibiose symporter-like transporter